uniref:AS2 protein n=1 Tax=Thelypteris nipponica TaxID=2925009 RepID=A0A411F6V9_9MONI|nr:AS2 protein [Coryphopteris nipponica]
MASSSGSPCAACKFLRRKCTAECVFAPYFPPDQPHKFANVHKIFGASNITKLLNELPPHQREDAVNSLAYEADARVKDPVYGCVGAISVLQRQIAQLQQELAMAHSDLARIGSVGNTQGALLAGPSTLHAGPLASGMGLALPPSMQPSARDQILSTRDQYFSARDQQSRLARDAQFLELQRENQMTREQLIEQLTRAGGGSLEAGLAAFGMGGYGMHHGALASNYPRSTSEGGSGSSGGGASMNRLSPP